MRVANWLATVKPSDLTILLSDVHRWFEYIRQDEMIVAGRCFYCCCCHERGSAHGRGHFVRGMSFRTCEAQLLIIF